MQNIIGVFFIHHWEILHCVCQSVTKYFIMKKNPNICCQDPKADCSKMEDDDVRKTSGGPVYLRRAIKQCLQ